MRLRVPSPRDGWRIFIGEVGVIVLGVLIALGAQEAVSEWNMRRDVRDFETTIKREIGYNLYSYDVRDAQFDCIRSNARTMSAWLRKVRTGETAEPIAEFAFPRSIITYRSAWDNKNPTVFANVPETRKLRYSEFYDELANNDRLAWEEIDAWMEIARFSEPGVVGVEERRQAAVALMKIRGFNQLLRGNFDLSRNIASALNATPIRPANIPADTMSEAKKCTTMKLLDPQ